VHFALISLALVTGLDDAIRDYPAHRPNGIFSGQFAQASRETV
jgi:hypothetical protein